MQPPRNRSRTARRALAAVLAVLGAVLALGSTIGVLDAAVGGLGAPAVGERLQPLPVLLLGFGLLTAAVGVLALVAWGSGRERAGGTGRQSARDGRAKADAVVVMGFVSLHLLALLVAIVAAAHAGLVADGLPWRVPAAWGLASAAWLATSYGWDRWTATDVDEVLEGSSWYRQ